MATKLVMFSESIEHDRNDDVAMKEGEVAAGQVPNEA